MVCQVTSLLLEIFFRVNWFAQLLVRVSYWLWLAISLWLKNSKEFSESLYFGHQNTWILLFNFQWAVLSAEPCGWQLNYYTTFSSVCQDLFQNFFAVFFAPASGSHRRSVLSGSVIRCSLTALIVYHTRPALSTPFSKFFQVFCLFLGQHGGPGGISSVFRDSAFLCATIHDPWSCLTKAICPVL